MKKRDGARLTNAGAAVYLFKKEEALAEGDRSLLRPRLTSSVQAEAAKSTGMD